MIPEQTTVDTRSPAVSGLQASSVDPKANKVRIDYLDGLRGLAALAVVILHAFQMFGLGMEPVGVVSDALLTGAGAERLLPPLFYNVIGFGAYAVEVFIVISGYSLMLAVARSQDGKLKGGLRAYFKRRVRRIWPPYYAALLLSLLIIFTVPGMNEKSGMYWDLAIPVDGQGLVSHALFFHYLRPEWFYQINPPMWTVALEEHIYVVFPFFLLPIWRRLGALPLAVLGTVGSVLLWYALRPWFGGANFWFVGLFALGAAGASIGFARGEWNRRLRERLPWGTLGVLALIAFFAFVQYTIRVDSRMEQLPWLDDLILGVGIAALLIHFTELWKETRPTPRWSPLRLLRAPVVVALGVFSYSLYLMHAPLLALVARGIRDSGVTSLPAYALIVGIGIPVAVIGAYLFHLIFERPFMPGHATQHLPVLVPWNWVRTRVAAGVRGILSLVTR